MPHTAVWTSVFTIVVLAAGCGGHTERNRHESASGSASPGATGTSGSTAVTGGRTTTLRGCVQNGVPAGTYVLRSSGAWAAPGGAAGTSGGASGSSETDTNQAPSGQGQEVAGLYRLIPTGSLDIGRHVGREVMATGEMAGQAADDTRGTTGAPGDERGSVSSDNRRQRQATGGQGDSGTNLENSASRGSGGGRQGEVSARRADGRFFRVTAMNEVKDNCGAGSER